MTSRLRKSSLLSISLTIALAGCGGGSSGGSSSEAVNTAYVQKYAAVTLNHFIEEPYGREEFYFRSAKDNTELAYNYDGDYNLQGVYSSGPVTAQCRANYCMTGSNPMNITDANWESKMQSLNLQDGRTMRYPTINEVNDESELLKIWINKNDLTPAREQMILNAVDRISNVIGVQVFNSSIDYADFKFTASTHDAHVHNMFDGYDGTDRSSVPNGSVYQLIQSNPNGAGLIVSWGTNPNLACDQYVGSHTNVLFGFAKGGFLVDENGYYTSRNYNVVNLGQNSWSCNNMDEVTEDLIAHEIAHALGLGEHFDDFGSNAVWGDGAEAVLRAIYNHPALTKFSELQKID